MPFSLLTRWTALIVTCWAGISIALLLAHFLPDQPCWCCAVPCCACCRWPSYIRAQLQSSCRCFALSGTVTSYQDGDFGFSLRWPQDDELADLVAAHNALGDVLRKQRLDLVQRELLLDTMVQNTPVAMLLVAEGSAIVYANLAARQLLHQGRRLEGHHLADIVQQAAPALPNAGAPQRRLFTTARGNRKRWITWRGAASA